jgi:hypothetical protein
MCTAQLFGNKYLVETPEEITTLVIVKDGFTLRGETGAVDLWERGNRTVSVIKPFGPFTDEIGYIKQPGQIVVNRGMWRTVLVEKDPAGFDMLRMAEIHNDPLPTGYRSVRVIYSEPLPIDYPLQVWTGELAAELESYIESFTDRARSAVDVMPLSVVDEYGLD